MERRTVYYSGQVQGVGFRYTASNLAAGYDVAGYVRNLPDGRVELVAEGSAEEINRFLDDIAHTMRRYIRQSEAHCSPSTGEFRDFGILR
jgi:acylphosphatase